MVRGYIFVDCCEHHGVGHRALAIVKAICFAKGGLDIQTEHQGEVVPITQKFTYNLKKNVLPIMIFVEGKIFPLNVKGLRVVSGMYHSNVVQFIILK